MVAVYLLDHLLPGGHGRRGRGDIHKLHVLPLHLLLHGCHRLMACTARSAPRRPHVYQHRLALIPVEDGLEDILRLHVVELLEEDAFLLGQFLSQPFLFLLIVGDDALAVFILHLRHQSVPLLLVCAEHKIHRLQLVEPGSPCAEVLVQLAQRQCPEPVAARRCRLVQILIAVCLLRLGEHQQAVVRPE